jgi:3-methyl-2-oxobutanoate hydroxymethyltransferase
MNATRKKVTIQKLKQMKADGQRIAALGVYDTPMAVIAERVGFEILMIGNSGPMSLLGYTDSTDIVPEDLMYMSRAVRRASPQALLVATMPFMSYFGSEEKAIETAAWMVRAGGADAVQCHADRHSCGNIKAIVRAGVPVLAHIGLRSVRKVEQSGFRVQGKSVASAEELVADAIALQEAGVFAIVAELIPAQLTGHLRKLLEVPVISLGSGADADGIYQVSADVVGFSVFTRPKTAVQFVNVRPLIEEAVTKYCAEVASRNFPPKSEERCMAPGELEKLQKITSH